MSRDKECRRPHRQSRTKPEDVSRGGPTAPAAEPAEAGYMLLAVIFMVALVLLSLAIAAPKVTAAIQRDRELELVHRGEQYKRAIRLYYKKFGSYPSSIDQLEKTNNLRFLRQRYLDPMTGKDDWKLVLLGHAHVCPLGFFGQPLGTSSLTGATSVAATAAASGSGFGGSSAATSSFGSTGSASSFGSSSLSSSPSGIDASAAAVGTGTAPCSAQTGAGSADPSSAAASGTGAASSGSSMGAGSTGTTDTGGTSSAAAATSGFGSGPGATSTSSTLGQGSSTNSGFGAATSTTLGGAPIMGVMPPMTKATILEYKLKKHYNEWEFVYWPAEEQTASASILGGSGNINGTGNSVNGPGSSTSSGTTGGSSTFGGSSFGGSSGSSFGSSNSSSSGSMGGSATSGGGSSQGNPPTQ